MQKIYSTIIRIVVIAFFALLSVKSMSQAIQLSESVIGTYQSFSTDSRSYQSLIGSIPVNSFSNTGFTKLSVLSSGDHVVTVKGITSPLEPIVFPNPTSGLLNINSESGSEVIQAMIFSIYGNLLSGREILGHHIDISELVPGAYILRLSDQSGNVWQYRIIKI